MLKTIQIDGIHTKLNPNIEDYVYQKIGQLDKFIPKKYRQSVKVDVKLKEAKTKTKDKFTCEVIFKLPQETITVHEKAQTFEASIDLSEDKLKTQLKKYKDKHSDPRLHRRLANNLKKFPQLRSKK